MYRKLKHALRAFAVVTTFAVTLRADNFPRQQSATSPKPDLCFVLDRSLSMQEQNRLPLLIGSMLEMVTILPDGARVSVVVFNHAANTLVPPTILTPASRIEIVNRLATVRAEGGTDILAAVALGAQSLPPGGIIVLLSDGAQSGNSNVPVPEAKWNAAAGELTRRLRGQQIVVHSLAMASDAESLLRRMSSETGGTFFPIPDSRKLLAHFVELAAQLGRFWRRSESGDLIVAAAEVVVCVDLAGPQAPRHVLFRVPPGGSPLPVDAAFQLERSGVRAMRFDLRPGTYRFTPAVGSHQSDLLRPMQLKWTLPKLVALPAGRTSSVAIRTESIAPGVDLDNIQIHASIPTGTGAARHNPTADARSAALLRTEGASRPSANAVEFPLLVSTPHKIGQKLTFAFEAEQAGWHFTLGEWAVQLASPSPVEIIIRREDPGSSALDVTTIGNAMETVVDFTVSCDHLAVRPQLVVASLHPGIVATPQHLLINQRESHFQVRLKRLDDVNGLRTPITGSVSFTAQAEDLIPPTVNGKPEARWDFRWRHFVPTLRLNGLPPRDTVLPMRRGAGTSLPVTLEADDLESITSGKRPGVRLDGSRLPAGFELVWGLKDGTRSSTVDVLTPDSAGPAELRVVVSRDALPGRYPLEFTVHSTHSQVVLGQSATSADYRLVAVVEPVAVQTKLVSGGDKWSLLAPIAAARRTVVVEVKSEDGGPLPPIVVHLQPDKRLRVIAVQKLLVSKSRLQAAFEVIVPAQSTPMTANVSFLPKGAVCCSQDCTLAVEVRPVRIQVASKTITIERYPKYWDVLLRLFQKRPLHKLSLIVAGEGWSEAACSWRVDAHLPNGTVQSWEPDAEGLVLLDIPDDEPLPTHEFVLSSRYKHTQFLPSPRIPIIVEAALVPAPRWLQLGIGLFFAAAYLLIRPPLPVKIQTASGNIYRRLHQLALHRYLQVSGVKLSLKRSFRGVRLSRPQRDRSGCRVVVSSKGELGPGESLYVNRGDAVDVYSPDGPVDHVEILCGSPAPLDNDDPSSLALTSLTDWPQYSHSS